MAFEISVETTSTRKSMNNCSKTPPTNKCSIYLLVVVVLLVMLDGTNGQFFTKSSKSIPRMGRRSLPDYQNSLEAYQQMIAEDYNYNELAATPPPPSRLEAVAFGANLDRTSMDGGQSSRRSLADLIRSRAKVVDDEYAPKLSRDERSIESVYMR